MEATALHGERREERECLKQWSYVIDCAHKLSIFTEPAKISILRRIELEFLGLKTKGNFSVNLARYTKQLAKGEKYKFLNF